MVGPNGSGKSNVVDALAWVMGEQGAKNLRGGKMEDVIFAGTVKKQALGRAEVALTIDNTDGALPIDYTEVTISRTLFRSGGSEYRVNGEPARLLDIQELLSDSGLGKEMHVIVGQGRLDAILHADPFERRGFIEEAAGVLKHRKRKEKALRKLTGLQTNLDRLSDLRSSSRVSWARWAGRRRPRSAPRSCRPCCVTRPPDCSRMTWSRPRRGSPRRRRTTIPQSAGGPRRSASDCSMRRSGRPRRLVAPSMPRRTRCMSDAPRSRRSTPGQVHSPSGAGDRVSMLRSAAQQQRPAGESPDALRGRAERFEAEHGEAESDAEQRRTTLADLTAEKEDVDARLAAAERELAAERARIAARMKHRAELASAVAVAQRTLAHAESAISSLEAESSGSDEQIERAEAAVAAARDRLTATEAGESSLDEDHTAAAKAVAGLEEERTALVDDRSARQAELVGLRAKAEGQRASSRLTAELTDLVDAGLPGLRGAVAQHLRIVPGCEVAVTAAIGTLSSAVLTEDRASALALLDHVGEEGLVDVLHPRAGASQSTAASSRSEAGQQASVRSAAPVPTAEAAPQPDATLPAASAVTASAPDLAEALAGLLTDITLAGSRDAALARLDEHPRETVIALDGTVYADGRAARAGSPEAGQIAARAALDETLAAMDEAETRISDLDERIAAFDEPLAAARERERTAMAALHESDAAIMAAGEELARATGELERLAARASATADSLTQAAKRREAAVAELEGARRAVADDEADGDDQDEPDTAVRDELADARAAMGERTVDARVGLRSAEDRVTFLADRIRSLRRQADQEEAARAQAARTAEARRRQADAAGEIARIAAAVAERVGVWQQEAEAALAGALRRAPAPRGGRGRAPRTPSGGRGRPREGGGCGARGPARPRASPPPPRGARAACRRRRRPVRGEPHRAVRPASPGAGPRPTARRRRRGCGPVSRCSPVRRGRRSGRGRRGPLPAVRARGRGEDPGEGEEGALLRSDRSTRWRSRSSRRCRRGTTTSRSRSRTWSGPARS